MLRATLKSLLARKLRLTLSTIAVVLSVMFVSGSFVLTDTLGRSFDALFSDVYTYTDVEVHPNAGAGDESQGAFATLPASVVDKIKSAPGVQDAAGQVFINGAQVVGHDGKLVPSSGGQRFGANWTGENDLVKLVAGTGPSGDDQVVVNKGLATTGKYAVGDAIDIKTPGGRMTFRVAGVFQYAGGRDSLAGEQTVFFTEKVAQADMLGAPGEYSYVDVKAASGVTAAKLRDTLKSYLGDGYQVKTGPELAKDSAAPAKDLFKYVNYVLIGFGLVALLVGVFLILNTFSIIVAQRTQELALLRAMGAGRGQVLGSVLLEAVLVGLVGSAVGFGAGVGLGALGAAGLGATTNLQIASLGVPPAAVILAFVIGVTVTVVAALVPALRAARVAPIAAMRESSATDRPLTKLTVTGGVVTAAGAAALGFGLNGAGDGTLPLILTGVLLVLVGVALLTPLIARPVVSVLGRAFSWSVPGQLGRRNSARNPRRTAITAAAVMIGIAVVTAISTVFSSLSASITTLVDQQLRADLVISGDMSGGTVPTIEPEELTAIRNLPGVQTLATVTYDVAKVTDGAGGRTTAVFAYDDFAAARSVLQLTATAGSIDAIGPGQLVVDKATADGHKYKVGDTVTIALARSGVKTYTLVGITNRTDVAAGYTISYADAKAGFQQSKAVQGYVKVRDGTSVTQVRDQVADALEHNPVESVQTREDFVSGSTQVFDILLAAVQILLLAALGISVLGVVNTLVLSVIERTRELGMLRAIGLRRGQTMRMVTTESVVIVLFGTLLGLVVGGGLGAAVVKALKQVLGFGSVALPWGLMITYLMAALVVGVLAAVIPAIRAARLNVLGAIAYE
jgi:putative ABC transport system permease protein